MGWGCPSCCDLTRAEGAFRAGSARRALFAHSDPAPPPPRHHNTCARTSHPPPLRRSDWDHNDWVPLPEHTACVRTTTQLMLMQDDAGDGRILLAPAWPADWHVDFKLRAPGRTTVEGSYAGGAFVVRAVDPPARAADVVVLGPTASGGASETLVAALERDVAVRPRMPHGGGSRARRGVSGAQQ